MMNKEQIKVFSRGTGCIKLPSLYQLYPTSNSFLYLFHLFQRSFPRSRSFERIPAMCIVLRNYVENYVRNRSRRIEMILEKRFYVLLDAFLFRS